MIKNEILLTSGLQQLKGLHWQAENEQATVVLVHGFGEHITRYEHVARKFTEKRLSVIGVDLTGHGHSTGKRGHVNSIDDFFACIEAMVNHVQAKTKPLVLYGHSMGGNLVLNYQIRHPQSPFCCVLATSPWLQLAMQPSPAQLFLAKTMNKIFPSLQQTGDLDITQISSVEAVQKDYASDPLNHNKISVRLFNEIYRHGLQALNKAATIGVPVLIAHGGADGITSAAASKEFAAHCPKATLKLWPGLRHETHNEHNKDEVLDFYTDWIIGEMG